MLGEDSRMVRFGAGLGAVGYSHRLDGKSQAVGSEQRPTFIDISRGNFVTRITVSTMLHGNNRDRKFILVLILSYIHQLVNQVPINANIIQQAKCPIILLLKTWFDSDEDKQKIYKTVDDLFDLCKYSDFHTMFAVDNQQINFTGNAKQLFQVFCGTNIQNKEDLMKFIGQWQDPENLGGYVKKLFDKKYSWCLYTLACGAYIESPDSLEKFARAAGVELLSIFALNAGIKSIEELGKFAYIVYPDMTDKQLLKFAAEIGITKAEIFAQFILAANPSLKSLTQQQQVECLAHFAKCAKRNVSVEELVVFAKAANLKTPQCLGILARGVWQEDTQRWYLFAKCAGVTSSEEFGAFAAGVGLTNPEDLAKFAALAGLKNIDDLLRFAEQTEFNTCDEAKEFAKNTRLKKTLQDCLVQRLLAMLLIKKVSQDLMTPLGNLPHSLSTRFYRKNRI